MAKAKVLRQLSAQGALPGCWSTFIPQSFARALGARVTLTNDKDDDWFGRVHADFLDVCLARCVSVWQEDGDSDMRLAYELSQDGEDVRCESL
jgi:hypothetical protein